MLHILMTIDCIKKSVMKSALLSSIAFLSSASIVDNVGVVRGDLSTIPSELKIIVEWNSISPSGQERHRRLTEIEQEESYTDLLPSRQADGTYGSNKAFSMYTIKSLINKFFNGRFFDIVKAEDVPELKSHSAHIADVQRLNSVGIDIIVAKNADDAKLILESLQKDPNVLFAELDSPMSIAKPVLKGEIPDDAAAEATTLTPNDRYFSLLWGMNNNLDTDVNGPELWGEMNPSTFASSDDNIVVAVIDTGVSLGHEDLKNQLWVNKGEIPGNGKDDDGNGYIDDVNGYDFYNNDSDPTDDNMHGSHCSGTILATGNNSVGVAGVFWGAKVMALKTMDSKGSGSYSAAVSALNYAAAMGAHATSNSWGGGASTTSLKNALNNAPIMHVCAAGNDGKSNDSTQQYPSGYTLDLDNVISIAAIDSTGALASFSNYGTNSVDIAAPGVDIASTCLDGKYCYASGTSMATPHVSGVVAAMLARGKQLVDAAGQSQAKYGPFPVDIKNALKSSVKQLSSLNGKIKSGGTVDAVAAVEAIEILIKNRLPSGSTTTTTTKSQTTTTTTKSQTTTTTTRNSSDNADCQVGDWSEWSACSSKCGIGSKTRSRSVVPGGKNGKACPTNNTGKQTCFGFNCFGSLWSLFGNQNGEQFNDDTDIVMFDDVLVSSDAAMDGDFAFEILEDDRSTSAPSIFGEEESTEDSSSSSDDIDDDIDEKVQNDIVEGGRI